MMAWNKRDNVQVEIINMERDFGEWFFYCLDEKLNPYYLRKDDLCTTKEHVDDVKWNNRRAYTPATIDRYDDYGVLPTGGR